MNTVNIRILSLLVGLLLSGCASMPDPELVRAQQELAQTKRSAQQREEQERLREEQEKSESLRILNDRLLAAVKGGTMRLSEAYATYHAALVKAWGPLDPYQEEIDLYSIATIEREEAGEITYAQRRYLITEKEAEIHKRTKDEEDRKQALEQQDRARQQALLIERQRADEQEFANVQEAKHRAASIGPQASRIQAPAWERWIDSVSDDGDVIKLEDGSVWEIDSVDAVISTIWLPVSEIVACDGKLINVDDGESVSGMRIR